MKESTNSIVSNAAVNGNRARQGRRMKNLISFFIVIAMTACGSGSDFSGSGGKAKPAQKTADAKPTKKPAKTEPTSSTNADNLGDESEEDTTDLDQGTVSPDVIDDDIKLPDNVVVKGSFRAWTVPADPEPFTAYEIFIDIKLPSNAANYTQSDLSGSVVGTDGYSQPIGRDALAIGFHGQRFEAQNGRATLILSVPGALNQVKDTINIKSDLLNETQAIEIVF